MTLLALSDSLCAPVYNVRVSIANMTETSLLKLSKSVEKFTTDFYKNVAEEIKDNLVSSALSAHTVLSMAALGADGKTARKMCQALHLSDNDSDTCREYQSLIETLNNLPNIILRIANKICISDSIRIKDDFKTLTSTYFSSESIELNFSQLEKSAELINQWCLEKTEGKIQEIVDAESLSARTGLILLNAVYFKGNWKNQFFKEFTKTKSFHVDKTKTINVPMMFIQEEFFYEELDDVKAICVALPYENEDLVMVIIVPKAIDGLRKVEENLKKIKLDYENLKENERKINLTLPRFKISTTINLKKSLEEMGFSLMFTNKADFNKISDKPLQVGSVIQKAFIEVNEEGTEAAAVTALACVDRCARSQPIDVTVDRPFFYRIVDIKRKITLFSGHVVEPS